MGNNQLTQTHDLAGKTKLTAVSIYSSGKKLSFFASLQHDAKGNAILPQAMLDKKLDALRVQRGQTYTLGM